MYIHLRTLDWNQTSLAIGVRMTVSQSVTDDVSWRVKIGLRHLMLPSGVINDD